MEVEVSVKSLLVGLVSELEADVELSSISLELQLGHETVQPTYKTHKRLGCKISPRVRHTVWAEETHVAHTKETFIDGLGDTDCSDGET